MHTLFFTLLLSLPLLLSAEKIEEPDLKKLSETFGHLIGRSLKGPSFSFDLESLIKGVRAGAEGREAPMSDEAYEKGMSLLQEKLFAFEAEENLKRAEAFLKENGKKASVHSLSDGRLQYLVEKEGSGPSVPEGGTPLIHFHGTLLSGESFGSSREMGPIAIDLKRAIPGFNQGITGMKEGEKRKLFLHPDLAYGTSGELPPNSLLIFEVEILKAVQEEEKEEESSS